LSIEEPNMTAVRSEQRVRPVGRTAAASPLRITAGVLALSVAAWSLLFAGIRLFGRDMGPSNPFEGWMNFMLIVGAVGCLVTGIVVIAKQKKRGGATPWLVAGFAVLILVGALGLGSMVYSGTPGGDRITLFAAFAVLIPAALVIVMEKLRR
jgi:uncharacterized membrane protein SirB2